MVGGSAGGFYVVSIDCEHPEAAIQLYNYYYQKDCALSPDYDSTYHTTSSTAMEHPEWAFDWAVVKSFYPQQNLYIYRGVKAYLDGDQTIGYPVCLRVQVLCVREGPKGSPVLAEGDAYLACYDVLGHLAGRP